MRHAVEIPPERVADSPSEPAKETVSPKGKRRHIWRTLGVILFVLVVLGVIGRALMPGFVRDYVNRTLDRNPLYDGKVGYVRIHLWRGAYAIEDVRISKTSGNVPVPFFAAPRVDFAIQWDALLHGRIVGRIVMEKPEINFVDAPTEAEDQTGGGAPWLQIIKDLFPFRINSAVIKNGSIHFRAYQTEKPLDIYLSEVEASVENLGNIRDELNPLVATVQASGLAMDHAKFEYKMTLDPFAYRPTFRMAVRLLSLDVTKINDLARAYGKMDFERGWFDFVLEAEAKEGLLNGYAKPLFRDLKVFSLTQDVRDENFIALFWEALVGGATSLLKNRPRDQFGTVIPFSGDLTGQTSVDILTTIGNVLRNAFIRAYLPRLEGGREGINGLMFGPGELTDPISVGDG